MFNYKFKVIAHNLKFDTHFLEDLFSNNNSSVHTHHSNSFIPGSSDHIGKAANTGEDQGSTESRIISFLESKSV